MKINVMDKIWDRKSFEVGGHWPLWRGWKNRMTTQNRQKSNAKNVFEIKKKKIYISGRMFQRTKAYTQKKRAHTRKKGPKQEWSNLIGWWSWAKNSITKLRVKEKYKATIYNCKIGGIAGSYSVWQCLIGEILRFYSFVYYMYTVNYTFVCSIFIFVKSFNYLGDFKI